MMNPVLRREAVTSLRLEKFRRTDVLSWGNSTGRRHGDLYGHV